MPTSSMKEKKIVYNYRYNSAEHSKITYDMKREFDIWKTTLTHFEDYTSKWASWLGHILIPHFKLVLYK